MESIYEMSRREVSDVEMILWNLNMARRYLRIALDRGSELMYDEPEEYRHLDYQQRLSLADIMVQLDVLIGELN